MRPPSRRWPLLGGLVVLALLAALGRPAPPAVGVTSAATFSHPTPPPTPPPRPVPTPPATPAWRPPVSAPTWTPPPVVPPPRLTPVVPVVPLVPRPVVPAPAPLPTSPLSVLVPSLVGRDVSAARQLLFTVGLTVGSVTEVDSDAAPGTVLATSPRAGSFLPRGSAVNLVVAG